MLKIIAGEYRSRRLLSPEDAEHTRPYASRVKESVFAMLGDWVIDANVLDLFAGVGTVGLEAISRGAKHATMVEQARPIFRLLEQNVQELNCADRATLVHGDALGQACLLRVQRPVDLVFMDPPYAMMQNESSRQRVLQQASRCRSVMGDEGFLTLRTPMGPDDADLTIAGFEGPEPHEYGRSMWVMLYAPLPTADTD